MVCQHEVGTQEKITHNLKEIINSMSYTLGLLFEYYRYRHDAIVRVYADDRLLDELSLSSDIKMKCTNNVGPLVNRFFGPRNETPVLFTPEKLFLFEIDERHLCNRIRIEVQNAHNNHTNGFMTKFSYVEFKWIFLLPSCLLEHDNWVRLLERSERSSTGSYTAEAKVEKFPPPGLSGVKHILGGSFSMEFPLSRKHGIIHLARPKPGKIYVNRFFSRVLWAFGQLNMST